jgi:hypothetical protein
VLIGTGEETGMRTAELVGQATFPVMIIEPAGADEGAF